MAIISSQKDFPQREHDSDRMIEGSLDVFSRNIPGEHEVVVQCKWILIIQYTVSSPRDACMNQHERLLRGARMRIDMWILI